MPTFPTLSTGAIVQYPARRSIVYSTNVTRYIDGSEQRFRIFPAPIRRWLIRLSQLNALEIAAINQLFNISQGRRTTFVFIDPWTGTQHDNCCFETDEFHLKFANREAGETVLVVRTERSN